MTVNLNTAITPNFSRVGQTPVKAFPKKPSFWDKHKIRILLATAVSVAMISVAIFYSQMPKPGCVEGFYDDLSLSYCEGGNFKRSSKQGMPQGCYEKYRGLLESCKRGDKIPGCFHKNYYRELTPECKENPIATLCGGNYDYTEWVNEIYKWTNKRNSTSDQ